MTAKVIEERMNTAANVGADAERPATPSCSNEPP